MNFIYLACPYTARNKYLQHQRFEFATRAAGILTTHYSFTVFSPITHGHMITTAYPEARNLSHADWMRHCLRMLKFAGALYLLPLKGWTQSKGVMAEIKFAHTCDIPCFILHDTGAFHDFPLTEPTPYSLNALKLQPWPT